MTYVTEEAYGKALATVARYEAETRQLGEKYLPPEAELPDHEKTCQKNRYGLEHACSCERAMMRRRLQVQNAGRALDRRFLASLGSMEQYSWYEAAAEVDPAVSNPYKTVRRV